MAGDWPRSKHRRCDDSRHRSPAKTQGGQPSFRNGAGWGQAAGLLHLRHQIRARHQGHGVGANGVLARAERVQRLAITDEHGDLAFAHDELRAELLRAGFHDGEIDRALDWLDGLSTNPSFITPAFSHLSIAFLITPSRTRWSRISRSFR